MQTILWPHTPLTEEKIWAYANFAVEKCRTADIIWGYDIARMVVVPLYGRARIEQAISGTGSKGVEVFVAYDSRIIAAAEDDPYNPLELEFVTTMVEKAKGVCEYQSPDEPLTFPATFKPAAYQPLPRKAKPLKPPELRYTGGPGHQRIKPLPKKEE